MTTLDYTGLRLTGALRIEHLSSLSLHVGVNDHGWAVVEGEAGEDALEQLQGAVVGREQVILAQDESGVEQPLFAGIIRTAGLVTYSGYNRFRIELQTGTIQMDQVKRSRSFQDVGHTYSQVAQRVVSGYDDGAVIPTVGLDKPLGIPVIQYRETDWAFMKRLASWCGGVVVPESHYSYPRLWFGFPERAFTCTFPEDCYTSGISQRYYELGGAAAGYRRADFLYYDVPSSQMCDLGWYTVFKGQEFLICEKWAKLERGELTFTYRLGKPGLGWGRKQYNEKISGMTILGEVLSTERETVRLKLDIDEGWAPGGPYAYTWRPETGNMMYCMPQAGTRVSLYFPNYDEQAAMAVNCVRTNGSSCARMSDPSKRSFVTEHGKEMNLYPQEMSFLGGSNGSIRLDDGEGIFVKTDRKITVVAQEGICLKAKAAGLSAPMGELALARGNALTGEISTSVAQSNQYDFVSGMAFATGSVLCSYPAHGDAPQEGSFDVSGLIFATLGIVAAVAVVGALSLTGIGALAVGGLVFGAVTGALNTSKAAYDAGITGVEYWKTVALGALTGGVKGLFAGLALGLAPYAAEAFIASYFPIGLMVGGAYISSAALTTVGAYGLGVISSIFATLQVNEIASPVGSNYLRELTGMSEETYNSLSSMASSAASVIMMMGALNPRAWSDLKNNQNTINDVLSQGQRDIAGFFRPSLTYDQQRQRQAVYDVESGKIQFTNSHADNTPKGNYGEMKTDIDLEEAGYTRLSTTRVTSVYSPTHHGIDGVYKSPNPPPSYIIVESKYGTAQMSTTVGSGPQMSSRWIFGSRLDDAVGGELADEIRSLYFNNPSSVQSVLSRVSPDGTVTKFLLDNQGKIIGPFP